MRFVALLAASLFFLSIGPGAEAHDDAGSRAGDVDDGVTGNFVGAAGTYTNVNGYETYQGTMTCDREVGGDGSSVQPADEVTVDGSPGGSLPDSTWNDGGNGGACHTIDYGVPSYNTSGCLDDGARASQVGGTAVWIAAGCDWKTDGIACNPSAVRGGTTMCTIGGTHGDPPCTLPPCELSCGADGVVDAFNFGPGNTRVPYPFGGVIGDGCSPEDAIMAVFVFDATIVQGTTTTTYKTTNGAIWQVA